MSDDGTEVDRPISFGPRPDRIFSASESISKLVTALISAQGKFKTIPKTKTANAGQYAYTYADLATVFEHIRGPLTENGLTWTQPTSTTGREVTVVTVLAHTSGEWIASRMSLQATDIGPQKIGSAITYAKRYALTSLVGIASADEDDDAQAASGKAAEKPAEKKAAPKAGALGDTIGKDQITRLRAALKTHAVEEKAFGAYLKETYGYSKWTEIRQAHYGDLMNLAESGGFRPTTH